MKFGTQSASEAAAAAQVRMETFNLPEDTENSNLISVQALRPLLERVLKWYQDNGRSHSGLSLVEEVFDALWKGRSAKSPEVLSVAELLMQWYPASGQLDKARRLMDSLHASHASATLRSTSLLVPLTLFYNFEGGSELEAKIADNDIFLEF